MAMAQEVSLHSNPDLGPERLPLRDLWLTGGADFSVLCEGSKLDAGFAGELWPRSIHFPSLSKVQLRR